jgi:hypothetical protein
MKTWILAGVLLLSTSASAAETSKATYPPWDYSAGFDARGRPLGAIFTGEFGCGFLLWGEPRKDEAVWKYGYLRPVFQAETIGVNTRLGVALEIFPVAFAGLIFKNEYGLRYTEPKDLSCSGIECKGGIWRSSAELRWGLEAKGIFWVGSATVMAASSLTATDGFYEDRSVLVGVGNSDRVVTLVNVVGYRFNDMWLAGLYNAWNGMKRPGTQDDLALALVRRSEGRWAVSAGAGYYVSDVSSQGLSGVIQLQWTGEKGLGLF